MTNAADTESLTAADQSPRYFHLLSAAELRDLKPVLEILKEHRAGVLAAWHERYVLHFAEARTLTEQDFMEVYGRDIDAVVKNLLQDDMEGFEADVRALGFHMVERGVPFAEVVASLHLFEESAAEFFQRRLRVMLKGPAVFLAFDKLSHCRMILLAGTYFAEHRSATSTRLSALENEATRLAGGVAARTRFHGLVGSAPAIRRVYEQVAAAGGGLGAVLVAGESGTGKELVARALHECGGRPERPFLAVNCAALPRELIESELFGHKKGAYTGAAGEYPGLVRAASGGTLFLDEISEMAAETQAKLLRVLEERAVRAVGAPHEIPVDVRFVASTNRDPEAAVAAGSLRRDLYYRLNVHRIDVPPLRERLADLGELFDHFAGLLAGRGLRRVEGIEPEALEVMRSYAWPGNVRELRNAVEHALTVAKGARVGRQDLPTHVVRGSRPGMPIAGPGELPTVQQAEIDLIRRALESTGGNKLQAARMLRISRHRLYDKLRKFGLEP